MLIVLALGHPLSGHWRFIRERLISNGHDVYVLSDGPVAIGDIAESANAILINFDSEPTQALQLAKAIKQDARFGWALIIGVTEGGCDDLVALTEQHIVDGVLFPSENPRLVAMQLAVLQKRASEFMHRRELLDKVASHESRIQSILETSPDALVTCSAEGAITDANRAATQMFGYTKEHMRGLKIEDLMPHRYRERHVSHRERFMEHPNSRRLDSGMQLLALRENSQEFPVDVALGWHDFEGQRFATAAIRDMSEQKAIEHNLRVAKERLEKAYSRLETDLRCASELQRSLLPKNTPELKGVHFAWAYEACAHLAGDAIDIFRLDDGHLGFYLVDVSGHGTSAALLSVTLANLLSPSLAASTILRIPRNNLRGYHIVTPAEVLRELNNEFIGRPAPGQMFTMLYGVLDARSLVLTFASAGHPEFLLHQRGQSPAPQRHPGYPVAVMEDADWEEHSLQLTPGTRLYFMSDGIMEAPNSVDKMLGIDGVCNLLLDSWDEDLNATVGRIREHVVHRDPQGVRDDISIIAIEVSSD